MVAIDHVWLGAHELFGVDDNGGRDRGEVGNGCRAGGRGGEGDGEVAGAALGGAGERSCHHSIKLVQEDDTCHQLSLQSGAWRRAVNGRRTCHDRRRWRRQQGRRAVTYDYTCAYANTLASAYLVFEPCVNARLGDVGEGVRASTRSSACGVNLGLWVQLQEVNQCD